MSLNWSLLRYLLKYRIDHNLRKMTAKKGKSNKQSKFLSPLDIILTIALLSLIILIFLINRHLTYNFCDACPLKSLLNFSTYFALILTTVVLILNKRIIFPILGWIIVILTFTFVLINYKGFYLSTNFTLLINTFFLIVFFYSILHLSIHSIARVISKKRRIITPRGLIHYLTIISVIIIFLILFSLVNKVSFLELFI